MQWRVVSENVNQSDIDESEWLISWTNLALKQVFDILVFCFDVAVS